MKSGIGIVLFAGVVAIICGCKHDNIEPILGPDLDQSGLLCVPDDFNYELDNDLNDSSINFLTETLLNTVRLSSEVTWEYGVKGSGGSWYQESGFGNEIVINWTGTTSNDILFETGDTCVLYVLFNCLDTIWIQSFTIEEGRRPDVVMVHDFDGEGPVSSWANANNQLLELNILANDSGAAQGTNYMRLVGEDLGLGSYLGQAMASPTAIDFGLEADATTLYLNSIVRATPNTILEYRIYENDGDWFSYEQTVDWVGWRKVAIRYDTFIPKVSNDGPEPAEIKQVRITLRSLDPTPQVVANIDYVNFSIGNPVQL